MRAEALAFLRGAEHIIHAGDIGDPAILEALRALAPVTAVRGNNDHGTWARAVPSNANVQIDGVAIHVLHDVKELRLQPGVRVVVSGHSHKPIVQERDGVLFVNPGSAGPRRFTLPVAVGELRIAGVTVKAQIRVLA